MSADLKSPASQIRHFAHYLIEKGRLRVGLALLFLLLGSLTEGISILLLVPLLQLVGSEREWLTFDLPEPFRVGELGIGLRIGLATVLVMVVLLVIAQSMFNRFKNIYMAEFLYDVINRLRTELFTSIARARRRPDGDARDAGGGQG